MSTCGMRLAQKDTKKSLWLTYSVEAVGANDLVILGTFVHLQAQLGGQCPRKMLVALNILGECVSAASETTCEWVHGLFLRITAMLRSLVKEKVMDGERIRRVARNAVDVVGSREYHGVVVGEGQSYVLEILQNTNIEVY